MHNFIQWNEINISIDYNSDYSSAYMMTYGKALAHLKIFADEPLPVTETGFRSMFLETSLIENAGGPNAFVVDFLNYVAAEKRWERKENIPIQLTLF